MNFTQAFLIQLREICSQLWGSQSQHLGLLLSVGEAKGAYSWKLFTEYKEWGLLHLLVLSGSQYYSFSNAWLFITQGLQRLLLGESFPLFCRLSLFPISYFYLYALGFPPPLVRCALLSLFLMSFSPLHFNKSILVLAVFLLHMALENFNPSDSAYLSWLAYLTLQLSNVLSPNPLVRVVFVSAVLHVYISYFKGAPLSGRSLLISALSNLLCLPLYERVLFPCIGFMSALCILLCPLTAFGLSPQYIEGLIYMPLAFILDLALLPVLVANSTFRYTFSE